MNYEGISLMQQIKNKQAAGLLVRAVRSLSAQMEGMKPTSGARILRNVFEFPKQRADLVFNHGFILHQKQDDTSLAENHVDETFAFLRPRLSPRMDIIRNFDHCAET
jgi:hypothetical protein